MSIMKNLRIVAAVLIFPLSWISLMAAPRAVITDLRCEHLVRPLGIDAANPRFTWRFDGVKGDFHQQSYQIEIDTDSLRLVKGKAGVWVSPRTESRLPLAVYSGDVSLKSHTRYYWRVISWDRGRKVTSAVSSFETAKMGRDDWQARWISDGQDKEVEAAPLFRKQFSLDKGVRSARVYVSATGYYELFINGLRVGDHHMDPGFTHFDKRVLYVTYDITELLREDDNAVAAALGNGFYNCQSRASWAFESARWRARPSMLCELRLTLDDGSEVVVATGDDWLTSTGGYTYNNIYSGDKYDARLEEPGWNGASFDDSRWSPAQIVASPAPLLVAQNMPAIRPVEEIRPVALKSFGDTIHVFDMGRNISGVCRLAVRGESGTTFTLQHGELLKANGRLEPGNIDVYYHPDKSGEVFQTDVFTLRGTGRDEVFAPQFTYHGFRYVEVKSDRPVRLTADNLTGLFMRTAIPQVGSFSCSNPLLNKIWNATMLSYQDNLHSIPTDCPQREKNGWTADAHVAIDLALLNFDGITLYEKWMNDFIDNQRADGTISGIIPTDTWGYGDWPGPVWDAALFIIPNALYNYYADMQCIERLYPTMERYLDYLKTKEKEDGTLDIGLGDWVFYRSQTPTDYTSTLYYYLDYKLMARFAELTGHDAGPYRAKADELCRLVNRKFFNDATGIYANGTQTAQGLALYLGVVPEGKEQLVADNLHRVVSDNDFFLDFGLLGSKSVPAMLTRYGYVDDVYRMVTKTEAPSWGYWVETQGYTTLAETWTLSPEFRDASLNHVFMGDISAWMTNCLAGINYDEEAPGWQSIRIRPYFVGGLDWVEGEYNSPAGTIRSAWKRDGDKVSLSVTVPCGCEATVYGDSEYTVGGGTHEFVFDCR